MKGKFPIIKTDWEGERLHLIHTFTSSKKEACKTAERLFATLGEKFRPQQYETIMSLQYCKLKRKTE